jgi:hypothetical protein
MRDFQFIYLTIKLLITDSPCNGLISCFLRALVNKIDVNSLVGTKS